MSLNYTDYHNHKELFRNEKMSLPADVNTLVHFVLISKFEYFPHLTGWRVD